MYGLDGFWLSSASRSGAEMNHRSAMYHKPTFPGTLGSIRATLALEWYSRYRLPLLRLQVRSGGL